HGLEMKDVQRVLLTHAHQDHFGLAARVADASGARLLGGKGDERGFAMERNAKMLLDAMARAGFDLLSRLAVVGSIAWVDRFAEAIESWDALDGGEVLSGDGYQVRVRPAPGHTPGSLTFEVPEAGVLFTGDTVLHAITPNAVVMEDPESPGEPFRSLSRYFETLDAINETNGNATLLTGHGRSISNYAGHRSNVARRAGLRQRNIEACLGSGPKTIRELVSSIFPRVTALNVFLAFSEIAGFLMYLEDLGRVEMLRERRRDRYRLTIAA
ncbi:MAG: MBL fold metallo-hydrolase, partial [Thermoanaerobaculia bacterium]